MQSVSVKLHLAKGFCVPFAAILQAKQPTYRAYLRRSPKNYTGRTIEDFQRQRQNFLFDNILHFAHDFAPRTARAAAELKGREHTHTHILADVNSPSPRHTPVWIAAVIVYCRISLFARKFYEFNEGGVPGVERGLLLQPTNDMWQQQQTTITTTKAPKYPV